jgi:hypothetical protein
LGPLDFRVGRFVATRYLIASRDARWVLLSHLDGEERDIMVLDNFR